ncbi:uncharacterized protein LOC128235438 [Mya arenaria]|uniref:uncharacterized protein LOC128235438 n=1 Tax=Mya arenaria TaxID=6604 RepID=UPI0022E3C78F|nr:uncharacterized protein LOC128235438 [Mya arenaria]
MEWTIRVCVEDQFECTRQIRLLENVFIPNPDCWSEPIFEIQGFSMQSWLSDNNVTLGDMLEEHHDKLAVDLGLVNMVSSPMCNITTSMQDFDFEFINSSSSIYDQSCVRSSTDEYVACCVYSEELDRYLWASFTIEPCRYQINVQLENLAYNINTLDYIWGTRHEVSMKGVWSIRFLIHNVQTNREFSLDVDVRICFEDGACNGTFFLAADFRLPYTNCTNTTQPYQDISHDFWLREECSASTTSTGCTSVHLPNATRDICFLDDDCRGLTCCAELYLGDVTRNAMFSIRSDCNGTALNFSIERKSWQTNIQSKPAYIHQNIKDAILLDITVNNDSPITIKVSVNLTLCEKISGEISCVALPYLIDQPLNVQCSTRKRRKRSMLPAEFSIEDIKLKLKELFEKGSSNKEIQSYIDALKIVQKAQKAKNMAPEDVEVLDSTIKQAMKALGWNNPETIKHQPVPEGGYTFSYEIGGAETILEMLGDSNSMISRANQLFIVGKGLSKLGTELLGAQLANMTIGDIESLLHTKKVDPFKIRDIVKAFIDLARVLYSEVMEKLLSGSYKNIFESFELTLKGTFSFPKKNIRFFPEPWYQSIPLGGFLEITLEFDAWGYYGLDVGWQAKIISRSAGATLLPYAGLSTFFEAGIGFILYGKLRLEGQICNIDFPSTAEIGFSKFPLDVGIKMDLKIKPLKLELFGLVTLEVNLLFVRFKKTLFKKRIWHYEMAQISTRVIDASTKEEDVSPPDFSPVVSKTSSRSGRALTECVLRQIANRDYTEPAFEIAVKAADDRSNVKFFLDVGTFQGGNDIVSNMQLGGSETVVKTESNEYPSGVPLYFIMFAENSAGSRSLLNCELSTYDSTPPTGRVNVEFTSTSNPNIIRATILVHDDSDISETLVAIGLGTEHYGDQLLRWEHLMLKDNSNRKFGNQPLDEFTQLQEGKLVTSPINFLNTVTASDCAQECLKIPPCHSFNYDYGQSMACELLPSMRHFDESLHMDSQFHHFERLSSGKFVEISYDSFDMRHNTLHFVNLDVTNVLGYRSVIHSQGILTDFSCPEPGLILNGSLDALSFVNCHTLVPSDRPDLSRFCTGQTAVVPNHRTVIDGPGSRTVFNGDNPMTETLYSRSNNYIAANWDGIHDNETGILVYTWFVGRSVCEDSIHPDVDPHKHLLHESHWRNIGIISSSSTNKNIFPLSSGRYYVSVRAMNKVHFGGFLGTTICHSIPYVIDITSPFIYEIYAIKYNEDTFLVSALHNSTDEESGIAYMDACLGRDLWSCNIMSWARSSTLTLIQFTFQIPDGTPAWLRLRATNNVDLHVVERANRAILLDASPPIAGVVNDGEIYSEDLQFTKYSDKICTNWHDFHDPESGISKYEIGVGSKPGMLDVVGLEGVKHNEHLFCFKLQENETLVHDNVYYITLWAFNAATNMKNVSKSSDGVRVDLTKPLQGNVVDGDFSNFKDRKYSHSKSSVQVQWNNFHDPESGIRSYSASVERNRAGQTDVVKTEDDIDAALTFAAWKNLNLKHLDYIRSTIIAFNGALNENSNSSDGILIDLTSPTFEFIYDGTSLGTDIRFQSSLEELSVNYEVQDIDSGIVELKAQIHIVNQGFTKQLYPGGSGEWIVLENPKTTVFTKENLQLTLGSKYKFRFGAVNGAGLTAIFESDGVITDNTQPELEHLEVGVLSGDDEEIVFGYVWQADHDGIKASWVSSDHESGIIGVRFAVGTTPGSDDVLGWTTQEKYSKDAYLPCVLTDTDLSDSNNYFPVYFVSLATQNGAGLWSPVKTSTPIVVVPEDVTGIAVDGPRGGISNDIDYQGDMHTVTMSFSGFKSSLHGIQTYDWAIGTTPQGEDVQPYLEYAIRHSETEVSDLHGIGNEGQAQVTVDIEPKKTYFTTLRAITNAGNILQTKTDGFIVDTTPPNINILTLSSQSLESGKSAFQIDETALTGTWSYHDSEIHDANNVDNILHTTFSIGTYPFATDVANIKNLNASVDGTSSIDEKSILPALQGIPNILSVTVTNKANITAKAYSQSLIQDNTEPDTGIVECHEYIQSHFNVTCVWSGFADLQSKVERFYIFFGFEEGFDNIAPAYELSGDVHSYVTSALPVSHADTFYATVIAENSVGLQVRAYSSPISVDDTPPVSGVVVELKSASYIDPSDYEKTVQSTKMACESPDECNMVDAVCQEKMNTIRAAWSPFIDAESGIKSLQVAVGTIPGGGQLKPFFQIPNSAQNYEINGINLYDKREIFVTIKAENNAGKTASVISNGVFLSYLSQEMPPLYHIGVYDSNQHSIGDIDYQVETSSLEAKWDVSGDPCPIIKYEWAIESTDGRVIQNFTDMYTSTHGVNDQLDLKEGERYYSLLRVTNAIGFSYTLRSNGVTVSSDVLIPGEVYDGAIQGYDLTVQQSRTNVSANWDAFGKVKSALEGQLETVICFCFILGNQGFETNSEEAPEIEYYEVALGTDRRFPKTRDNVVPFTNVGRKTSVTFLNLDLDSGDVVYYFTVRAYSKTFATAFAMSNGFYVKFNGGVNAGEISMPSFVNDTNQLQYSWNGFSSEVDIMVYYIALSNGFANESDCKKYIVGQNGSDMTTPLFNIVGVTNVQVDTMVLLDNLDLIQNNTYYAWVLGLDKSGECNMTYHRFNVDITPPTIGNITAGPYYDMDIAYSSSSDTLRVQWKGFADNESGISRFNLTLWTSSHCRENALLPTVSLDVLSEYTNHTFYNITLKPETVYFVSVEAVNNALLRTVAFTSPIIYDSSKPSAGYVAEGADIKEDVVWWGNASSVIGTLLHYPLWVDDECPQQDAIMTGEDWTALDIEHINDPDGIQWGLKYRHANVHIVNKDVIKIKMSRDTKFKQLYSGAYMKSADFVNDGLYEINIKINENDGLAVTGVTFWDGESGDLHLFDHNPVENWSSIDECLCCQAESEVNECPCNCTEYWNNFDSNATSTDYSGSESASLNSTLYSSLVVPAERACGIQIYGGSNPYVVTWCRFNNTSYQPMSVKSNLQFDPAEKYHKYSIKFLANREDLQVTQCIKAYADQYELSEMCGIPQLSKTTMLILHVWNKNSIIPEMNVFNSWTSYSFFKTLKLPPNDSELCRYAQPWKGGTNPIISYEAGIGSSRTVTDVVDFRQVIQPCIPCSGLCSELICNSSCVRDTYTSMMFTIYDTDLSFHTNGSLYIIVKSLLGSGERTLSASNGFYIDTSPPTFDLEATFYIDVNQGEFTPAEYQGSSDTIKAVWFCEDDLNEIREYEWAIGSYIGGEDLQRYTSTGVTSIGTNTSFEGILKSNTTYYVSVRCTNEAGLVTVLNDTKGVTVLLEAPSEDSINTSAVNADKFDEDVFPPTALETSDPTSCGERWSESSDDTVDRYDFCIGSSKMTPDDIVPCVWVAVNTSGTVEIKDGHMYINGVQYFKLSELQAYSKAHYTVKKNSNNSENIFNMEPGRTVFLFMRICNKAQICSFKLTNSVIVKGKDSSLAISKNGTAMSVILGQSPAGKQKRSSEYSINATFPGGMNDGQSVLLKELSEKELTTIYQSDATPAFKPYIVNPFETLNKTERLLYKRTYYVEKSFTISPIGQEELTGAIEITHQQINFDDSDPDSNITMLLHWNPDEEEWQISSRSCQDNSDTETHYPDLGVTIVKVCNTRTHNSSNDTQQYMYKETQFAVATVRAGPFNSPPYLISPLNISLLEDSEFVTFQLYARDDELDDIVFTQFNFQHPIGNIELNNSGWLEIELCANCYGHLSLEIELKDTPSFVEVTPAKSIGTINVYVVEQNDPPTALLYSMEGENLLKSDPTEPVIFIQEQQIKPAVFDLAIFTAFDVDINESIQLEISASLSTSSGFSVQGSELPSCIDNVSILCCQWDSIFNYDNLVFSDMRLY